MLNMNFGNVIESNNSLICYAKKALPFENHIESVKNYKKNIKECLNRIQINDNQVLIAEYYTPKSNVFSDIENKLL